MSVSTSGSQNVTIINSKKLWIYGYEDLADPRTKDWLLVSSFTPVLAWDALYLLMAFYLPKIAIRYKPRQLKPILIAYNTAMALLNFHILKEVVVNAAQLNYNYLCQPCRVIYSKHEIKLAAAVWWFYFSKLLEFSDTLFFILRHKWKQLTPLHIYHHSTMFPLWWIAIKWLPTGSSTIYYWASLGPTGYPGQM
uniref:Elongation of very long chain fatty acids protein n=1 Tax=Stomoxys calcitrans TaxID=35570 RepID=A0A1I8Q6W5_STOCA